MNVKIFNKKGELTTTQIVMVVVLIVSFAIILLFIWRLNLNKVSDQELCHKSLLLRATSPVKEPLSIDCKTKYVCLSKGERCEQALKAEVIEINSKDDIFQVFADEMSSCWYVVGEGHLDYASGFIGRSYCGICSTIYLSDSAIKELSENPSITSAELYQYLSNNKQSGKEISYFQYLYGTSTSGELIQKIRDDGDSEHKMEILNLMYRSRISSSDQWIILTAEDKNNFFKDIFGFENSHLPPFAAVPNKESFDEIECDEFFTQA